MCINIYVYKPVYTYIRIPAQYMIACVYVSTNVTQQCMHMLCIYTHRNKYI